MNRADIRREAFKCLPLAERLAYTRVEMREAELRGHAEDAAFWRGYLEIILTGGTDERQLPTPE